MLLRCSGCGELVSEWASRCPSCGRDTEDAEALPEPVELAPAAAQALGISRAGEDLPPNLVSPGLAMSHAAVPFGGQAPRTSPTFARMVPLSRADLACALDIWWAGDAAPNALRVQRRLELGPPRGDSTLGWTFKGRVRRLTTWHWVPVVIELWCVYDDFVKMTMTPEVRVLASKRYYRLGHAVLDRLWADLVETSSRVKRAAA
jgi:hypothetical protein